ncbi:Crossover junction endodeoxyribonuclease RuvC [Methylacidimicrobium sp. AP8]|uniref:crossover junction endodeoxyribonuclease RuvC n=1 Tax=Methylacidimicrobium sp. AP8 TaxID=2730359 RepID=UPI0018C04A30|nr:crossover junction endodeoxyribonuclease RuvC [Methylacidimicrobium sp. AP8]CAB4244483.1 Crossover junction endodeoxyribonuclease RuvC [Methylacidimicrobium sp. AP8]
MGIDPSLRRTGYGVLELLPDGERLLDFGVIVVSSRKSELDCLREIHRAISRVLVEQKAEEIAIERVIYVQNHRTAIQLGAARGVALLAAGNAELPVFEYPPRRAKTAATGYGGSRKAQVAFMIRSLLGLRQNLPPDAADAVAVALAHAAARRRSLVTGSPL